MILKILGVTMYSIVQMAPENRGDAKLFPELIKRSPGPDGLHCASHVRFLIVCTIINGFISKHDSARHCIIRPVQAGLEPARSALFALPAARREFLSEKTW
jgi:hypothetical protein